MYTEEVSFTLLFLKQWHWRGNKGPILLEWIPDFQFSSTLPSRSILRGRAYSSILFDSSTSLIVAASSLQARFTSFDEDGTKLWEPEGEYIKNVFNGIWLTYIFTFFADHTYCYHHAASNVSEPYADCSALELIAPDIWVTMDGSVGGSRL